MRNVFLTGPVQVGKTTAVRRFLCANPALRPGGFSTKNLPVPGGSGEREVYILPPVWTEADLLPSRVVARGKDGYWTLWPERFDREGVDFLRREGPFDLLLMDELGRMELGAPDFRAAVLAALDGPLPVLGVVKPEHNPLLDAVRAHPRTIVLEVSEKNRDRIPGEIAAFLGPMGPAGEP